MQKRNICFLILQKYLRTSSFDIYIFFNLRYGAAAGVAQLLTCNALKGGQGMVRAAYTQFTSDDTLNPAELP